MFAFPFFLKWAKPTIGFAAIIWFALAGWRIGFCKLANIELQDDLREIRALASTKASRPLSSFDEDPHAAVSDEELRSAVIAKAKGHGIRLEPDQVTVERSNSGEVPAVSLSVDYVVPVSLPGYSFALHFTPSSADPSF